MFFLHDTNGIAQDFNKIEELKEYIEIRHAEEGGFDWISEMKDEHGRQYGCSWKLDIEEI